jgi:cytochrome c oxidase subunit 3
MNIFRQLMVKPWETEQGPVVELLDERTFSQPTAKIGLRLFLIVVAVFFSLMLSAYIERKVFSDWNSLSLPWLLWLNTAILVASSMAMHYALVHARRGQIDGVRTGLSAGGILAFAFLAGQLLAWRELVASGYYVSSDPSNAFFYMLTGVHGVHLIGGLVAWGRTMAKIRRGDDVVQVRLSVDLCAVYWHFLLLLWLVLFALMLLT